MKKNKKVEINIILCYNKNNHCKINQGILVIEQEANIMKALYYEVKLRLIGVMYNEGFIIVYIDGDKLIKVEGMFTFDYLCAHNIKGNLYVDYYKHNPCSTEKSTTYKKFEFVLNVKQLQFPINTIFRFKNLNTEVQVSTIRKIDNPSEQKRCIEKVNEFVKKWLLD